MLQALRAQLEKDIRKYLADPQQLDALVRVLSFPGFALHPEAPCRAGVLTLLTYQAVLGRLGKEAIQAAGAVEMHMEAAYLFDSVGDEEVDPQHGLTSAEELALAARPRNTVGECLGV